MDNLENKKRYEVVDIANVPPVPCPCGMTRRAYTDDPDQVASLHVVQVSRQSKTHYHKKMTELYYILSGTGYLELDGERFAVGPGSSALIKPGCRHRAVGDLKLLNVPIPAFDAGDEYFDPEQPS